MTKTELLDELMKKNMHCPFYGKGAAGCDVGRGYISVSVVAHDRELLQREVRGVRDVPDAGSTATREPHRTADADGNPGQPETDRRGHVARQRRTGAGSSRFAGTAINLALGILYTWSIFKGAIKASIEKGGAGAFRWDLASINDPYAVCCLVFAFAMIVAGKCQDKVGPRVTALVGGAPRRRRLLLDLPDHQLRGVGPRLRRARRHRHRLRLLVGDPARPSSGSRRRRTGLIAGLVVSGFGLASVYIAPLATWLLKRYGLQQAMLFFGIGFLFVVSGLSMLLTNPPKGYVRRRRARRAAGARATKPRRATTPPPRS